MRIASVVHDSIVDGPGIRMTVFTQGCKHACKGCHNPETHAMHGGRDCSVEALLQELRGTKLARGLTISGGEPFLQASDCKALAAGARRLGFDVWVYTGYRWETLIEDDVAAAFLAEIDVLVDGLFIEAQKSYTLSFRGSTNQRLIDVKESLRAGSVILWEEPKMLCHFQKPES